MKVYNTAAWLPQPKSTLNVSPAPFPSPESLSPDDLVVRARAVAINPVDWKVQSFAVFPISYPAILGADVAGEVVSVGSSITGRFHPGDRVIGHALGFGYGWAYSAFQNFVVLKGSTASILPDGVRFVEGVVLPVSVSTATAGLFWGDTLSLRLPKVKDEETAGEENEVEGENKKETLLLWGGSSSVGSSVIQLATAAGYDVVATASASNFEYVKGLGATGVVDYHDEDVVEKLVEVLRNTKVVGAFDSIGTEDTIRQTASVLSKVGGGKIASVGAKPEDIEENVTVVGFSAGSIDVHDVKVGKAIWEEYVPKALKRRDLVPAPEPLVVGEGLGDVQKGLDRQKEGVSAQKVVVLL